MSLLRRKQRGPGSATRAKPAPDRGSSAATTAARARGSSAWSSRSLIAIGFYLAFTKQIPFTGQGYELHATFENATTLKPQSPVRIAGVNVGKVTTVERARQHGRASPSPSTTRACRSTRTPRSTIRPRLFLEGNFFLDLQPGSPSAPTSRAAATIPVTQTATAVQLDQVLTSLQTDTRKGLQRALAGYGTALNYQPTAAEDATQDPAVQGLTGAEALNQTFRYGGKAGRDTAIVNEALLGEHPHDLST